MSLYDSWHRRDNWTSDRDAPRWSSYSHMCLCVCVCVFLWVCVCVCVPMHVYVCACVYLENWQITHFTDDAVTQSITVCICRSVRLHPPIHPPPALSSRISKLGSGSDFEAYFIRLGIAAGRARYTKNRVRERERERDSPRHHKFNRYINSFVSVCSFCSAFMLWKIWSLICINVNMCTTWKHFILS